MPSDGDGQDRPLRTILVAYDDEEAADRAVGRAAQLAEASGARLVVLSIAPAIEVPPSVEALEPSLGTTPISSARIAVDPAAVTPGADQPARPFDCVLDRADPACTTFCPSARRTCVLKLPRALLCSARRSCSRWVLASVAFCGKLDMLLAAG